MWSPGIEMLGLHDILWVGLAPQTSRWLCKIHMESNLIKGLCYLPSHAGRLWAHQVIVVRHKLIVILWNCAGNRVKAFLNSYLSLFNRRLDLKDNFEVFNKLDFNGFNICDTIMHWDVLTHFFGGQTFEQGFGRSVACSNPMESCMDLGTFHSTNVIHPKRVS